jgi:Domain of unknown function (DUF4129)
MSRSRVVPLALAVTALLAIVAVVARGRPVGSQGGNDGGLPLSFWDYTYTTIAIVVVPLMLAGAFALMFVGRRQGKKQNYWQSLLKSLAVWAAFVVLELVLIRNGFLARHLHFHLPATPESGRGLGSPGQHGSTSHGSDATRSLSFRWGELAILLGLIVVTVAIFAVRHARRDRARRDESAPEALAAALDQSIDDLRGDPDLRRAIVAAYARMESALAAAGIPRHPAEAPLEYLERVLLSLDTSAEAVRRLTDLFEWARFSHHAPEPSMRDDAVDALVAVRDELRASELIPA